MEKLNDEEIEGKYRADFTEQEREKKGQWDLKGQQWPTIRASWEVY